MKRFMYLVIWGVCLRPLSKVYPAETLDAGGAPTTELDGYDYRQGDGYLFTIKTAFDIACDKSPLQLFIEGDRRISSLSASHRVADGVVELCADDLTYFEPGEVVDLEYFTVETDEELEILNREFDPPAFVEEFPALARLYSFNPDPMEF